MAPTLGSALTLSIAAYMFKSIVGLGTKGLNVKGLPILLNALREHPVESRKGKEKAVESDKENSFDDLEMLRGRRGIVSGASASLFIIERSPTTGQ